MAMKRSPIAAFLLSALVLVTFASSGGLAESPVTAALETDQHPCARVEGAAPCNKSASVPSPVPAGDGCDPLRSPCAVFCRLLADASMADGAGPMRSAGLRWLEFEARAITRPWNAPDPVPWA